MSNREVAAAAKVLGHEWVRIEATASGRRYTVECSCGFGRPRRDGAPSVTRATLAEAVSTAQYHLRQAVKQAQDSARRDGRVVPPHLRAAL